MLLRGAGDVSLHTRFLSPIPTLPAVAQYSVGWSVFHGAHTAVLGIGFFGNPFCHCPYAQSQRHQGTCATDRWGLPFPTDARISNVSPHMPL